MFCDDDDDDAGESDVVEMESDVDVCRKDGIKKVENIEAREVESAEFLLHFFVAFFLLSQGSKAQGQNLSNELKLKKCQTNFLFR